MKTLNDYFTKIYVINLDRRPDRYIQCQIEFEKIGINVERVPAIDGNEIPNSFGLSSRDKACFALTSVHRKLINDAISNKYESILVFEDDVTFIDNFNTIFNEKIEFLPDDWELLYLGGNYMLHVPGFDLITGDKDFKVTKENYKTLNYELCKTPCVWCAHAIAINLRFYGKILNEMKEHPINCIDTALYNTQPGSKVYGFLPSLAIQKPDFSDIEGGHVNYGNMTQVNF